MTTVNPNSTSRLFPESFGKFPNLQYEHLIGGVSGGVTSTLILHPFDLIKIRFAVNDGKSSHTPQYKSVSNAFKVIIKEEGFRGLYKGVTPNVLGSGTAWGLYFLYFNTLKTWLQDGNTKQPLGFAQNMFAAAQAGAFTLIITNPIWVVKTRLCLQIREDASSCTQRYNGVIDALRKIYRTEGMRGLYKGFVPGLLGVSHGSIQFMVYEEMKSTYYKRRNKPVNEKLPTPWYMLFAAVSKIIAAGTTYPYQVVRARLQDQNHSYAGTVDCIRKIFRFEGVFGFYKGLSPNLIRVVSSTVLTFGIYENVTHFLREFVK